MEIDLSKVNRSRDFQNHQIQEFFKDINFKNIKKGRVLELGCGEGKVLNYLSKKFKYECFGVDLYEPLEKVNFNFIKSNILDLKLENFENKGFNFIYSFRVFCYLSDIEKRYLIHNIYNQFLNIGGICLLDIMGDGRNKKFIQYTSDDIDLIVDYSQYKGFEIIQKNYKLIKNKEEVLKNNKYTEEEKDIILKYFIKKKFISYTLKFTKTKNNIEELLKTT